MPTEAGLPGWFPEDFSTDPELLEAFEDDGDWHAAGGNGKPASGKQGAPAVHGHAVTWDDISAVVELATTLDFYNPAGNPGQARIPTGQVHAGQFTKGQSQQQAKGKPPAKGKTPPAGKPDAHQQHVAHEKNGLLKTARTDRAKAAALIKQRDTLRAELASASGATTSGQSGSKTSGQSGSTTSSGASTTSSSSAASSSGSSASSSPSSSSGGSSSSSMTAAQGAQVQSQIDSLNAQIGGLLQSAKQAQAQAAKL